MARIQPAYEYRNSREVDEDSIVIDDHANDRLTRITIVTRKKRARASEREQRQTGPREFILLVIPWLVAIKVTDH